MITTYLIRKADINGNPILAIASKSEWISITLQNRSLPADKRRYFISDCIVDGSDMDLMVIEVSYEEHRKWNREHMRAMRNINEGKKYLHLSLDAPTESNPDIELNEVAEDSFCLEATVLEEYSIETISQILRKWNIWAVDMLDMYLDGNAKGSAALIAQKYGVSERMGFKYKKQFEVFIKKLILEFSF